MECVLTHLYVSQMSVKVLRNDDSIRDLILYQKEKLLHEAIDAMGFMPQTVIPRVFEDLDDSERRGMIRGLRWVLDDEDLF